MKIRQEQPKDIPAISQLLQQAFTDHPYSGNDEHLIIERLRTAKALSLALVAEQAEEIVGYIALSPVLINQQASNWLGIAPLAVLPAKQRQGIGSQLMLHTLQHIKQQRFDGCVLIGFPEYYQRFGFIQAAPLVYPALDRQFFMAYSFNTKIPSGEVAFHTAFS